MKAVVDRIVQYANRYQLTDVTTGEVLGTFDFDEVTGTVQQVGTEIDKELFDSIADDLAARVVSNGGELANTIVTFSDISGTAANVASGDKTSTLWGKVKNWFSRLKALAFKDKINNADVAADAAIAQSKISGLTDSLNGKQPTITGGASTIASNNLTANRALVSNGSGKVGVSAVTSTELGYLDGVTSNIQSQFNGIEDGNTVVGKAIADKNGNDIFDTYATKEGLTASSRGLFSTSQDLTDKPIGATVQVPVISGEAGAIPKVDDYVYDEWGNFARLVSVASNGKWNVVPFAKASNSYTTSNPPPYPVVANGTYSGMTVGNATNAVNAQTAENAVNATNAQNAVNAQTATTAATAEKVAHKLTITTGDTTQEFDGSANKSVNLTTLSPSDSVNCLFHTVTLICDSTRVTDVTLWAVSKSKTDSLISLNDNSVDPGSSVEDIAMFIKITGRNGGLSANRSLVNMKTGDFEDNLAFNTLYMVIEDTEIEAT